MVSINVNGTKHQLDADPKMPLLWAIRDILGLTGTKFGCGVAQCGACVVHLDGEAARSCVTTLARAEGKNIVTIEGLALGAATIHEITFRDGKTEQSNFYNYKMPRIYDIPPIEVHIMENDAPAGGVGEPGLPAFAPALTNAVYDLTGKRIRKLPFSMASV